MKTKRQRKEMAIPQEWLDEEHEPIDFGELIKPCLRVDVKALRKRFAEEKAERKRQRELKKQNKNN